MARSRSPQVLLDTSVIVAGLQAWHENHDEASSVLNQVLASRSAVLPSRALVEAFSVMTRMPAPHRLSPRDAFSLLKNTFEKGVALVQMSAGSYWDFLEGLTREGVTGGTVYDAEIVECARQAGIGNILTLNRRHFERLAPEGIRVRTPTDH